MYKVKISKATVIKALKNEPLKANDFFHFNGENENSNIFECQVCAVGAVLRNSLPKNKLSTMDFTDSFNLGENSTEFNYSSDNDYTPNQLLKRGNYLGALSVQFEITMIGKKFVTAKIVDDLVKFVNKNFPKTFTINV